MDAILIEGLRKTFGSVAALDGLELNVERGTVYGFLGPNGAGKTTTIRILAGLARPSAGRVSMAGVEFGPGGQRGSDFRRRIGYLPEEPGFYGWMTPREYLAGFVAPLFDINPGESRSRADELLALVGLAEAAKRRIGGFSRGMRQRLGLAQALINRPDVLLLDEPVSALDPAGRREILKLIEQLRGETTVFMSTHVLADVERVCDAVGIIHMGRLVVQAGRDELLARYSTPIFEIQFDAGEAEVGAWVESLDGSGLIAGTHVEGRAVRLTVHDASLAKSAMPALIAACGLPVQKYEWVRPSLEDVFLKLVQTESGSQSDK